MDFEYRISIIVPVYNAAEYLEDCLKSLLCQTMPESEMEILLINDGSTDNSEEICKSYASGHSCIKYYFRENSGPSATRNFGLQNARGKYVAFLDSDDRLTPDSLKNLANFFDKNYDRIDLVTYQITPIFNGIKGKLHYRYQFLKRQGVYDLLSPESTYICQTTMNICIKNRFENNILFDTSLNKHEDQKFNIDVVKEKMKIGYCTGAEYLYTKNPQSITHTSFYAYYLFESSMSFWESLFSEYENSEVPPYFQAMYINDLIWKLKSDILLPYHYQMKEGLYESAVARIRSLITRVDSEVIVNHPQMDDMHKGFFVSLKNNADIHALLGPSGNVLADRGKPIYQEDRITLTVTHFNPGNNCVDIDAFLKSPVFSFSEQPELYVNTVGENETELCPVPLSSSNWDYYLCKIKTNTFYRFRYQWDYTKIKEIAFFTKNPDGKYSPVHLDFTNFTPFHTDLQRNEYFYKTHSFAVTKTGFSCRPAASGRIRKANKAYLRNVFHKDKYIFAVRLLLSKLVRRDTADRIWLYCDCKNVYKDNAYYQFIHDFDKPDGVRRYYVVNDKIDRSGLFSKKQRKYVIRYNTLKHKKLFFESEKIITAFAEWNNFSPMFSNNWRYFSDMFHADVIYLQHGVLHAFLPWKYSKERLPGIDKEVVSTNFELENLTGNYGFGQDDIIPAGMPRYDFIPSAQPSEKKVLFAPTWRKYLVGTDNIGNMFPNESAFKKSDFYRETYALLHSEKLKECLKKNGYTLDFKLHPIFAGYGHLYDLDNSSPVRLAGKSVDEYSYRIFVTDFSSYGFDFVYLKRTFMYFVPDLEKFYAGMNDYRKLDLPFEKGFGPLTLTAEEAESALCGIIENDGKPDQKYAERMDGFFLYYDNDCRDRIYAAISK